METKKLEHLPTSYYRIGQEVLINCYGETFVSEIVKIGACERNPLTCRHRNAGLINYKLSEVQPVLRRMESMSEKEKYSYRNFERPIIIGETYVTDVLDPIVTDWLDAHGFDRPRWINGVEYESLIAAGQAVDAETLETK